MEPNTPEPVPPTEPPRPVPTDEELERELYPEDEDQIDVPPVSPPVPAHTEQPPYELPG